MRREVIIWAPFLRGRVQDDIRIGEWVIQPQLHTISRNTQVTHLEPKAMQVLVYLAKHGDEVVSKDCLLREVWSDTFVTDDVLTRCISELRRAFDDNPKNPRVIQTVPRSGYRLIAPVQSVTKENRAEVRRPRQFPLVLAAAFAVALLLFVTDVGGVRRRLWGPQPVSKIQSLVVLPLENLSRDPEQEYFADGMTDELTTELVKIGGLRVISRTSAVHYKGTSKTLPEVAQELRVDAVIEGTVQRSGDRVRVRAQLIEAQTDRHLWAESYERDVRDVLALEGDLARAIAHQVHLQLTPGNHANLMETRKLNPEAHEAYLKGLYYWGKLTEVDVRKSIMYFDEAIRLAPDFAPAYARLAFSYNLLASNLYVAPQDGYPKAKELARRALGIDANLANAHAALGFAVESFDWDWRAAEAEYRWANELEPNGQGAHQVYALYLSKTGRHKEAIAEMTRSAELDPLSVLTLWNLGWIYWSAAQPERAVEQFRKILEIDPNSPDGHQGLGMLYAVQKQHQDGIAELQTAVKLSPEDSWMKAWLGYAYAVAGRKKEALEVVSDLERTSRRKYVSAYLIATVYAGLGNEDATFRWLEKAFEQRDTQILTLKLDPLFESARSDPRFEPFVRRVGFP